MQNIVGFVSLPSYYGMYSYLAVILGHGKSRCWIEWRVDSSVAAKLLEEGHEVIGIFMKNWHDDSVTISDDCPGSKIHKTPSLLPKNLAYLFRQLTSAKSTKNA